MYTLGQIQNIIKSKQYKWFENEGDYKLNIIGIRNSASDNVTNIFDDYICVCYQINNLWKISIWPATTDPGKKGVLEYSNPNGVAILVEGQYIDSHHIGLHKGQYEALCQLNPLKVYRDSNRDLRYDKTKIQEGIFGINIHHAGVDSTFVENWSEGCQVFKRIVDFNEFMVLCHKHKDLYGDKFTYTLIDSSDIV